MDGFPDESPSEPTLQIQYGSVVAALAFVAVLAFVVVVAVIAALLLLGWALFTYAGVTYVWDR